MIAPDGEGALIESDACLEPPSAAHTKASCSYGDYEKTCTITCESGYVFPGQTKHFKFELSCDKSADEWLSNGEKAGVPDCNRE